jgi:hypothetical protein
MAFLLAIDFRFRSVKQIHDGASYIILGDTLEVGWKQNKKYFQLELKQTELNLFRFFLVCFEKTKKQQFFWFVSVLIRCHGPVSKQPDTTIPVSKYSIPKNFKNQKTHPLTRCCTGCCREIRSGAEQRS